MLKKTTEAYLFEIEPRELNGLVNDNPFEFTLKLVAVPSGKDCFAVFGQLVGKHNICLNGKVISIKGTSDVDELKLNLERVLRSEMFDLRKLVERYEEKSEKLNKSKRN